MRCAVLLFSALVLLTAAATAGEAAQRQSSKARANAAATAKTKAKAKQTVRGRAKSKKVTKKANKKATVKASSKSKTTAKPIRAERQERTERSSPLEAAPVVERAAKPEPSGATIDQQTGAPAPSGDTSPPPFSPTEVREAGAPSVAAPRDDEGGPETNRACLDRLRAAAVHFEAAQPTQGVRTPIVVLGPLGRVHLVHRERRGKAPLMDCELARALLEVEPILAELGVDELRFSGAYQYRVRRGTTRLSEHAHGLAIDVHTFHLRDGRELDVLRDFAVGAGVWGALPPDDEGACVGSPPGEAGRLLRRLGCRLRMSSALRTVMTPDDDDDHRNHFHVETFPDPGTRARIILQRGRARPE